MLTPLVVAAAGHVVLNPLFWNIVARREHRTHFITKMFGSAQKGVYALAVVIFTLGLSRDFLFTRAVASQPGLVLSPQSAHIASVVGYSLCAVGFTLVLTSTLALGITGTYLGDYFGILLPARVTAFPFNLLDSPMYTGSTITFLGHSIVKASPIGLALTALVFAVYKVAQVFEEFVSF